MNKGYVSAYESSYYSVVYQLVGGGFKDLSDGAIEIYDASGTCIDTYKKSVNKYHPSKNKKHFEGLVSEN